MGIRDSVGCLGFAASVTSDRLARPLPEILLLVGSPRRSFYRDRRASASASAISSKARRRQARRGRARLSRLSLAGSHWVIGLSAWRWRWR